MRVEALKLLAGVAVAGAALLVREYRQPPPVRTEARSSFMVLSAPPEVAVLVQRAHAKSRLARRVIAERTPLLDAAELFRRANGEDGMLALVDMVEGRSVREKLCRQVIYYVAGAENEMEHEGRVRTGPRVSAELQAELDRRLAAGELPPEPEMRDLWE
jgi:hypothetical protein